MSRVLPVVMIAALAGCTTYVKPGASDYDRDRNLAECRYEAEKAAASQPSGVAAGWAKGEVESRCMSLRGYALTFR